MEALRRIKANQVEKRLLNARGEPNFNINFYILNAKKRNAGKMKHKPSPSKQEGPKAGADGAVPKGVRVGLQPQLPTSILSRKKGNAGT